MDTVIKMKQEIIELQKAIHSYIDIHGIHDSIKTLKKYLDLSDGDNMKLTYVLENTEISGVIQRENEKHDILCCIAKALNCYEKELPKENIYSKSELYEYDPSKNGKNILKHEVSFNEICSYLNTDKGNLITHTRTRQGEARDVYFFIIDESHNLVAICDRPNLTTAQEAENIHISKLLKELMAEFPSQPIEILVQEALVKLKNERYEPAHIPVLRFISARYFSNDIADIEKTLREVIRDENLDSDALDDLRARCKELLEEYGYTNSQR